MYSYPICKSGFGFGYRILDGYRCESGYYPYSPQIFQPPAELAHSRQRRCAIQGFPRCIPARPSCARENPTLRAITGPSIQPFPFIHSIFRSQNSPADSPCNSHPTCSAPAAPQRTSAAVAGTSAPCSRATKFLSRWPQQWAAAPLPRHPPPSCCDGQEHSANLIRGRGQACLKAYRALVAPPPASPSDLLLNQQRLQVRHL
ncbi:hypothetical protein GQ55_1G074300 [Panicum hallii var. hallii]|uniref:Uncharacterized protein n=1 Tax=Panicum hallii var. hallii TaxID=1504633 RepID=A0A2T7F394_9POAL|nr:hypothetical protein GQ55_1G074300 [Panicum hallii var. hallii]